MRLHTKSDYACRALESLALHYPNEQPLRIEEIAQRHGISVNYLAQILLERRRRNDTLDLICDVIHAERVKIQRRVAAHFRQGKTSARSPASSTTMNSSG